MLRRATPSPAISGRVVPLLDDGRRPQQRQEAEGGGGRDHPAPGPGLPAGPLRGIGPASAAHALDGAHGQAHHQHGPDGAHRRQVADVRLDGQ
jgi:hypothetical protein